VHRTILVTVVAILASLALTACGGSGKTVTVVERTVVDSGQNAASPSQQQVSETEQPNSSATVPDVVGDRLDVAEDTLDEQGLDYKEIGGGTFGIVVRSNWEICETKPAAGDPVPAGNAVKLIVDRVGAC
jgi:hypothetical protein